MTQAEAARKGKGVKFDSEQLMWAIQGAESEQAYNEALGILRLANGCAADYVATQAGRQVRKTMRLNLSNLGSY